MRRLETTTPYPLHLPVPMSQVATSDGAPAAVTACLAILGESAFTWAGVVTHRINSRIHRARRGITDIAIKECFHPITFEPNPASAEREFAALRRIAASTEASGCCTLAPIPLVLCREHAAYAMSWVAGRPATEAILSADADRARNLGAAAGLWLRNFHALRPLARRSNDFGERLGYIGEILREIKPHDALAHRAAEALVDVATAAAAVELPASWIHGDMKSDNLLVDGDAVIGLDLQMADENTVVYDLAPFLNHMSLLRWSTRGFRRQRELCAMSESFLQAYSTDTPAWRLPICWLRAYLLFQVIARHASPLSLRARIARWPARMELAALADTLEDWR